MLTRIILLATLLAALAACATAPDQAALVSQSDSGAPAMLGELARVSGLPAEQRRREIAELDAGRRLDVARRFQLAALLAHDDAGESLERSLKLLNALGAPDARTAALLDLMKESLKVRLELKQQTARAQELQGRLEQIKALEKSLQQRNGGGKTP